MSERFAFFPKKGLDVPKVRWDVDSADKLMLFIGSAIGLAALTTVVEKYWPRFGWLVIPVVLTIIVLAWGARDSEFENWRQRYHRAKKKLEARKAHQD